jgi:hypothetical protein
MSATMKTGKLNIFHFIFISILIFILPVLKEWNLFIEGDRVNGLVTSTKKEITGQESLIRGVETRSLIEYSYKGKTYTILGPENLVYEEGRSIPMIIHPEKEGEFIIATFTGFYVQRRSIAIIIVFIIWIAIYSTIVQIQRGTVYKRRRS